jgi:hypothetical protein
VKDLAEVRLNGRELGVVWTAPWRVAIPSGVLKEKGNEMEIAVVNLWNNRVLGDSKLPAAQRVTLSNANGGGLALLPSGLLGPVRFMAEGQQ